MNENKDQSSVKNNKARKEKTKSTGNVSSKNIMIDFATPSDLLKISEKTGNKNNCNTKTNINNKTTKTKANSKKPKEIVINLDALDTRVNKKNCDISNKQKGNPKLKQSKLSFDILNSINNPKNNGDKTIVLNDALEIVPCRDPLEIPEINETDVKRETQLENATTITPIYKRSSPIDDDYYNSDDIDIIEEKLLSSNTSIEIVSPSAKEKPVSSSSSPTKNYPKKNPKCKICSREFTSHRKLREHKVEHEGDHPYKCTYCPRYCSTFEEITAHTRLHQGKLPYQCKKCDLGFKTKEEYNEHQPVHILRKTSICKKIFPCELCSKEFRKASDLERHARVHTGEKPAVCSICNKRFQQVHNLNKHLLIHIQLKAFNCEICGKAFGRSDVLNRHVLTHSVEKPHHCPNCSKSFIRMSQLNAHMFKHHKEVLI